MRAFSFFHKETGLFNGNQFIGTDDATVALNTPADHIAIDGHHDYLSRRVDVSSPPELVDVINQHGCTVGKRTVHKIVDYQPPAPSADHEWNTDTKRWQLSAVAVDKINRSNAARSRIAQLEASQHRHLREHALGKHGAREALQTIDDEIVALRIL